MYPTALVLALVPLFDPLARAWPFHPGDSGWRFLLVSLLIDHGAILLAALVIAFITGLLLDDRSSLRRLELAALVLGVVLLLLTVLMIIQVLLLQRGLDPALRGMDFGVTRRLLAGVLLGLASLAMGIGARRSLAGLPERTSGPRRTSDRIPGM
ncbi:MAG: hypothetical protein ABI836_04825 [Gemmatimonadota bacterium]